MRREEYAPAKLTWSFRVLGTRRDGYHELEALVVTLSAPGDVVLIEPSSAGISLRATGATRAVPDDASNLAWRAAAACDANVAIELTKRIPAGAGLGGGSADAAAVLRGLRHGFGVDPERVERVALELGSDVPVCLHGGPAWMRGRGDVVEPVELGEPTRVLTVVPPIHSSTAAVYGAWDELGGPRSSRRVPAPPGVASVLPELVNDLEPAAERVSPTLHGFREAFERAAGRPALLAGSGSAYCAWFEDPGDWRAATERVERELGVATFAGIAG